MQGWTNSKEMGDIITRVDIEKLIDRFYAKALKDEQIGHFFTEFVQGDWPAHVERICNFWDAMLLGAKNYQGNPMIKHIDLHKKIPFEKHHFDQWVSLWEATVREHFDGDVADEAISRAKSIADLMAFKITSG